MISSNMIGPKDANDDDDVVVVVVFTKEAQNLCINFMKKTISLKDVSLKLKANWVKYNIIEVDATYDEVSTNAPLIKTLLQYLGQGKRCFLSYNITYFLTFLIKGLPEEVNKSNYGNGLFSDHFLYFNCSNDTSLNEHIRKHYPQLAMDGLMTIQKCRDNLFQFVRTAKNNVLYLMELVGTPDKNAKRKAARIEKAKTVRTRDDINKEISTRENQISNKKTKTNPLNLIDNEAHVANLKNNRKDGERDEEEQEQQEEEQEQQEEQEQREQEQGGEEEEKNNGINITNTEGDKIPSSRDVLNKGKKLMSDIISAYPAVSEIGLFLLYDDLKKHMYVAEPEITQSFCQSYLQHLSSKEEA